MTINYRHMLLLGALFMASLTMMSWMQGFLDHSPVILAFEFLASALLLYWAIA